MVQRAQERLDGADIHSYTIATGSTVRKGFPVKLNGSGKIVEATAVTDNAIGIALQAGNGSNTVRDVTAPSIIRVAHFGKGVCKALVGTGGASEGAPAKWVADGTTDATVGGGTTKLRVLGQYLEAGVAGDLVGLNLGAASWGVGS